MSSALRPRSAVALFPKAAVVLAASALVACSEPSTAPVLEPGARTITATASTAPGSLAWQEEARSLVAANRQSALASARTYAALSVAQYLAVVDADDYLHREASLEAGGHAADGRSLVEARRGAVAGASAEVLVYLFPAAASRVEDLLQTQASAGHGNVHPYFKHGLSIGRSAGATLVERLRNDRFTAPWTGTVPVGEDKWIAAPNVTPVGATYGGVTPYLLTSAGQFRPLPPPAFGSPAFIADLDETRAFSDTRTPEQAALARQWNYPGGTFTPPGYWNLTAAGRIEALDLDEREATHILALMHASIMDALIGCWEAKYHYWVLRPSQVDRSITLVLPLPNHPSYPSGHSCASSAAKTVLSEFFPDGAAEFDRAVIEAGLSRIYAGIHFRFDITAGQDLGVAAARWAIDVDRSTGLLAALD